MAVTKNYLHGLVKYFKTNDFDTLDISISINFGIHLP